MACWTVCHPGHEPVSKYLFGTEAEQVELLEDITRADLVVAHNAKFELQWLKRCGVDLRKVLPVCTMLGEWVIHGNLRVPLNLDDTARRYGLGGKSSVVSALISAGVPIQDIPSKWLLQYCEQDVRITHDIFKRQRENLRERDQLHIWLTRNLTALVLADIEFNGMRLDKRRVGDEFKLQAGRCVQLGDRLSNTSGGINLNSPKQVAEFLYDTLQFRELTDRSGQPIRTPGGGRKAGADVVPQLHASTPEQREFQELYVQYRNSSSLLSKNLNFFKAICEENDGLFHASLNQGRTATHRLSSSGRPFTASDGERYSVQFQNLPRQYKKLFQATESGWLVGEVDGAQLEFRVGADLTRDPQAIRDIEVGEDVHANTASIMTDAGEPTSRQNAKAITFRPLLNMAAS